MPRAYCRMRSIPLILLSLLSLNLFAEGKIPKLPLAQVYHEGVELEEYWLSEKLDGVRAYWDGQQLVSKNGHVYHAPDWFIADFPSQPLDGELWAGRGRFEYLMTIVRDQEPSEEWRRVSYQVFDMPVQGVSFSERVARLKILFRQINSPYIDLVEQLQVSSHQALMKQLDEVIELGGEGLMLHKGTALYIAGRSSDLLKVKRYQDAEARVIGHLPGKGKYTGMLGALLVESEDKRRFRLGSGLTDAQRKVPPAIGALVTYKYYGETAKGLPRFASFLRVRAQPTIRADGE